MVATRSASQNLAQGVDASSAPSVPSAKTPSTTRRTNTRQSTTKAISSPSSSSSSTTTTTTAAAIYGWTHTPTTLTLAWLAISLPLVTWDTGYVLGRPATMPGGWAHWPLWAPYKLYGEVDHMYGFKQWNAGNGFTAAQGSLNVIETVMYLVYFAIWWRASPANVPGSRGGDSGPDGARRKTIAGRAAAWAVVFGFSAAVMTVSKTLLYWLNEGLSGFDNIGHNAPFDMLLLWIIPNGAWLVVPSYMIYQLGSEIIDAIDIASQATGSIKEE